MTNYLFSRDCIYSFKESAYSIAIQSIIVRMRVAFKRFYELHKQRIFAVWNFLYIWEQEFVQFTIEHQIKVFTYPKMFCRCIKKS